MAFPASALSKDDAFKRARLVMLDAKRRATLDRATMGAGPFRVEDLHILWTTLLSFRAQLQAYGAVPGLAAYAQDQLTNPGLNVAAEFNAVVAAMTAAINEAGTRIPRDASGSVQTQTINGEVTTDNTVGVAALATLRGLLLNLINTVE